MERDVLEPVPGLSREIGFYAAGLEEVRAQTVGLLKDLTEEELALRVMPGFHQVGGLALHLGECEFWWMHAGALGKEISDQEIKFAHIYDTTETDFAAKGYGSQDCIDFLAKIHEYSIKALAQFTDEDLDKVILFKHHPKPLEGTLRWILHHLIDHEANHKGQIAMIKRLIREEVN